MSNKMKASTLENKFPLLAMQHDCIISKDADITIAFKDIIKGTWCRKCSIVNKKSNIIEMQEMAKSRNGKSVSKEYANSQAKLVWLCEFRHQWEARPNNIKNKKS